MHDARAQLPATSAAPHSRSRPLPPYRGILAVDLKGFTERPAIDHEVVSRAVPEMLRISLERAGLARLWTDRLFPATTGDGYVLGFDPALMPLVIHPWLDTLQDVVAELNVHALGTAPLRLRVGLQHRSAARHRGRVRRQRNRPYRHAPAARLPSGQGPSWPSTASTSPMSRPSSRTAATRTPSPPGTPGGTATGSTRCRRPSTARRSPSAPGCTCRPLRPVARPGRSGRAARGPYRDAPAARRHRRAARRAGDHQHRLRPRRAAPDQPGRVRPPGPGGRP
ncbi:hypothetical protein LT493_23040 [Streptomyces tricolor]|nr:hypothetical protein [Streptomyces tricolor]